MTCESLMALSETQRPEVAGEVDVDKDLAYVLVDCKPTPKESVWQKIKARF